jgi:hypothetical protein
MADPAKQSSSSQKKPKQQLTEIDDLVVQVVS